MDAAFADYAWSNDVRIAKLTGQRFTEACRNQVLSHHGSRFDSTAERLLSGEAELRQTNAARVQRAQGLMHAMGAQGVPALVVTGPDGHRLLNDQVLYGSIEPLLAQLGH